MRAAKILMIVMLAGTLFWSERSAAELEGSNAG